jgi:hypothetical protein
MRSLLLMTAVLQHLSNKGHKQSVTLLMLQLDLPLSKHLSLVTVNS